MTPRIVAQAAVVAVTTGIGLGIVAGLPSGPNILVVPGGAPAVSATSLTDLREAFDATRAVQVGVAAGLLVAVVLLASVRTGILAPADPGSLT